MLASSLLRFALTAALILGASIAGADGSPLQLTFECEIFGGGDASVDQLCTNCPQDASSKLPLSVDGNLKTAASVSFHNNGDLAGQASSITIIAKAQEGIIFAAGKRPGLLLRDPEGALANYSMIMTVLQGGTPKDVEAVVPIHLGPSGGTTRYVGFADAVSEPFDRISLTIAEIRPGDGEENHVFRLQEFCANGQLVPLQ